MLGLALGKVQPVMTGFVCVSTMKPGSGKETVDMPWKGDET